MILKILCRQKGDFGRQTVQVQDKEVSQKTYRKLDVASRCQEGRKHPGGPCAVQ